MTYTFDDLPLKLPADFKTKWLSYLRSGTFVQGIGCLKSKIWCRDRDNAVHHCCLGVAAEALNVKWDEYDGDGDDLWSIDLSVISLVGCASIPIIFGKS